MKVAILCLFALVAVSQAAFTANLVQRTQPVLAKTFQHRFRSDSGLETSLFQGLNEYAQAIIQQIQDAITQGVATFGMVTDAVSQLQQLGGNAVEAATAILSNFWESLWGKSTKALDIGSVISALTSLNLQDVLGFAFNYVAQLISQLEVPTMIQNVLSSILSNDVVQQVMSLLFGRQKGLFGDLLAGLSGAASGLAAQVAGFVSQIQEQLASGMATAQEMAMQMLAEAQAQATVLTQQAANALLTQLAPLAASLGDKYEQIVAAINGFVGSN